MHVENLVEAGIERGGEHARSSGLAGAYLAGDQAHAVMLSEKLQPRLDLIPRLGGKQLFGVGAVGKRSFLETEKGFPHELLLLRFPGRQQSVDDRIDQARPALRLALGVDLQLGEIERIEARLDALAGQMRGGFEET